MSHPPVLAAATEPIVPGDELENPCTGERAVMVKSALEGGDGVLLVELHVQPHGAVVGEHIHHNLDERFLVKEGRIGFRLDGRESVAGPGEEIGIPRGHWHDWWNAGDEVAVVDVEVSPGERFMQMAETLFGLARDGHTDDKGLPHPLQLALFAPEFRDVLVLRRPPSWAQSAIFALLGPIARARGYRATYPQYGRSLLPPPGASG